MPASGNGGVASSPRWSRPRRAPRSPGVACAPSLCSPAITLRFGGRRERGRPARHAADRARSRSPTMPTAALRSASLRAHRPGAARWCVSLAPQDCLRKRLTLPAAVEENLAQALAYDLDRHTPFKPDELYFDAVRRRPQSGARHDHRRSRGGTTHRRRSCAEARRRVGCRGRGGGSRAAGQCRSIEAQPAATRNCARRVRSCGASTSGSRSCCSARSRSAAAAIPLWQKRDYVQQLDVDTNQARARAAVSENLRTELNARVGDYNFALERKYAFPGALAVVDTVSRILPDDTWLTQFEIKTLAKGKDSQRDVDDARRDRQCRPPRAAVRGIADVHAGGAARSRRRRSSPDRARSSISARS